MTNCLYGGGLGGGFPNGVRTGVGKNDRVKGIVDGPDDPAKAAFIDRIVQRYNLRAVSLAPTVVQPPQAPPRRRRRHNDVSDPNVPLKMRPVDVHVNGTEDLTCIICGKTVERVHCNQVTCGADKCKNRRNWERQKARPLTLHPAELLAACKVKGVVA